MVLREAYSHGINSVECSSGFIHNYYYGMLLIHHAQKIEKYRNTAIQKYSKYRPYFIPYRL